MSLQTWKNEFYKIEATDVSEEDAVAHSLRKWEGLLPENLSKHNISRTKGNYSIVDQSYNDFKINVNSCALCQHYLKSRGYTDDQWWCADCPLYQLNDMSCDGDTSTPFVIWLDTHDPKPMIEALKQCM